MIICKSLYQFFLNESFYNELKKHSAYPKYSKTIYIFLSFIFLLEGKRQCPGEPMAKVEVFMYFTSILQIFNVKVPEGKTLDFEGDLGIGLMPRRQELIFSKRS